MDRFRCEDCGAEFGRWKDYMADLDRHTAAYEAQYPYRKSEHE